MHCFDCMDLPALFIVPRQGSQLPRAPRRSTLGSSTLRGAVMGSVIELKSDVKGLRLVLGSELGDR
jgi:hypothetical protein